MEDNFNVLDAINTLKNMALVEKKVPTVEEIERELTNLKNRKINVENQVGDITNKLHGDYLVKEDERLEDQKKRLKIKEDLEAYYEYKKTYEKEIKALDTPIEDLKIAIKELNDSLDNYRKPEFANQFDVIIRELEEKLKNYEAQLEQYEAQRKSICDLLVKTNENIEANERAKQELENQIPKAINYIDENKQKALEEQLSIIKNELQQIENRIKYYEDHPVYLAHLATVAYNSGGIDLAYRYLEQITDIANNIPYMNTPESAIASLDQLESESISERNKAYKTKKTTDNVVKLLEARIKALDIPKDDTYEKDIALYKDNLVKKGTDILEVIKSTQEEINRLERELDYRNENLASNTLLDSEKEQYRLDITNINDRLSALKGLLASLFNEYKLLNQEIENLSEFEVLRSNTRIQLNAEKASIEVQLNTVKGKSVEYLVAKSEIQKQAETLMNGVIGIKHRREFSCSPDEMLMQIKNAFGKNKSINVDTPNVEEEPVLDNSQEELPTIEPQEIPVVDLDSLASERSSSINEELTGEIPVFPEPTETESLSTPIDVPSFNPSDAGLEQTIPIMPINTEIPEEIYKVVGIEPVHVKAAAKPNPNESELSADFTAITGGKSDLDDLGLNAADGNDLTGLLDGSFLDQTVGTPIIKR